MKKPSIIKYGGGIIVPSKMMVKSETPLSSFSKFPVLYTSFDDKKAKKLNYEINSFINCNLDTQYFNKNDLKNNSVFMFSYTMLFCQWSQDVIREKIIFKDVYNNFDERDGFRICNVKSDVKMIQDVCSVQIQLDHDLSLYLFFNAKFEENKIIVQFPNIRKLYSTLFNSENLSSRTLFENLTLNIKMPNIDIEYLDDINASNYKDYFGLHNVFDKSLKDEIIYKDDNFFNNIFNIFSDKPTISKIKMLTKLSINYNGIGR